MRFAAPSYSYGKGLRSEARTAVDGWMRTDGTSAKVQKFFSWMNESVLSESLVLQLDYAAVAHGGGWGDYQGGSGENYFHTLQVVAGTVALHASVR